MLPKFTGADSFPGDVSEAPRAAAAALPCRYGSSTQLVYYGGLPCCAEKRINFSNHRKEAMYGTDVWHCTADTASDTAWRSQAVPVRERRAGLGIMSCFQAYSGCTVYSTGLPGKCRPDVVHAFALHFLYVSESAPLSREHRKVVLAKVTVCHSECLGNVEVVPLRGSA
jgi:hypothetical protein